MDATWPPLSWRAIHPLLVCIPMVLLGLAAIATTAAALSSEHKRMFASSACFAMVFGALALCVTVVTGHLAWRERELSARVEAVLLEHHALAEGTVATFIGATFVLAVLVWLRVRFDLRVDELSPVLPIALILFYSIGLLLLISTVRHGQLVHAVGS